MPIHIQHSKTQRNSSCVGKKKKLRAREKPNTLKVRLESSRDIYGLGNIFNYSISRREVSAIAIRSFEIILAWTSRSLFFFLLCCLELDGAAIDLLEGEKYKADFFAISLLLLYIPHRVFFSRKKKI